RRRPRATAIRYSALGRGCRLGHRSGFRRGARATPLSTPRQAQSSRGGVTRRQDDAMSTNPVSTGATLAITVNGESRTIKPGATVIDLLQEIGLSSGRVAIERNLE